MNKLCDRLMAASETQLKDAKAEAGKNWESLRASLKYHWQGLADGLPLEPPPDFDGLTTFHEVRFEFEGMLPFFLRLKRTTGWGGYQWESLGYDYTPTHGGDIRNGCTWRVHSKWWGGNMYVQDVENAIALARLYFEKESS